MPPSRARVVAPGSIHVARRSASELTPPTQRHQQRTNEQPPHTPPPIVPTNEQRALSHARPRPTNGPPRHAAAHRRPSQPGPAPAPARPSQAISGQLPALETATRKKCRNRFFPIERNPGQSVFRDFSPPHEFRQPPTFPATAPTSRFLTAIFSFLIPQIYWQFFDFFDFLGTLTAHPATRATASAARHD